MLGSAALSAVVAIVATVAIERWGGRVGGLLATLPTTIVPASVGIFVESESVEAFRLAMYAVPVGMFVDALFLWSWRIVPPRLPDARIEIRLGIMLGTALCVWATAAALGMWTLGRVPAHGVLAGLVTLGIGAFGVFSCWAAPPAPGGTRPVGAVALLSRGLLAALAIGFSVWLAGLGSPLLAGMASVFPAIFLTTMVSLWLSQGESVPVGAVGPMILGTTSVAVFALVASWSIPALGLSAGSVVAWVAAVAGASAPAAVWLRGRSAAVTTADSPTPDR